VEAGPYQPEHGRLADYDIDFADAARAASLGGELIGNGDVEAASAVCR
jgi:hypothetical protein